jgi:quercetin dioxygenase-like cupin family protein
VIRIGALGIDFLVDGDQSNGSVAVFTATIPAGARVPAPHSHDAFEETIYGLEGVSTWTVDGEPRDIAPGDALLIPRGAVHGFVNDGEADAKALCIASPGVFGPAYFEEVAALFGGGGPPEPAQIGEVMRRHGLTPA